MILPKLTIEEQKQFTEGIVKVEGTAMNRTALGIVAAFFKLYPNATFKEIKEAFPDSINPSGPRAPKSIFKPYSERDFGVVHSLEIIKIEFEKAGLPYDGLFFLEQDEMFKTSDGITVVVCKLWDSKDLETGKSDLKNLAQKALEHGIFVDKFEFTRTFGKGTYKLEVLNQNLFNKVSGKTILVENDVIKEKKLFPLWVWIIIALVIILLILWLTGALK